MLLLFYFVFYFCNLNYLIILADVILVIPSFHWLDKIALTCIPNCQFLHLVYFFFLQIFQDSFKSQLQSCCSTFIHIYHFFCDDNVLVCVCVWFVQESRSASRSASPRAPAKSASRTPARSKDGSHHSRSKSWSRSRSRSG